MVLKHRKIDGHRVRPQLASTPGRVPTNHTFPHISIASSRNHFLEGSGMLKTSKRWRFNAPTAATSHSHHVMTFGCCIASNKEMANGQALAGTHLTGHGSTGSIEGLMMMMIIIITIITIIITIISNIPKLELEVKFTSVIHYQIITGHIQISA